MESIEDQLVGRLELGKERYGHGVIVNSDTVNGEHLKTLGLTCVKKSFWMQ
jgi:hypothetical protein